MAPKKTAILVPPKRFTAKNGVWRVFLHNFPNSEILETIPIITWALFPFQPPSSFGGQRWGEKFQRKTDFSTRFLANSLTFDFSFTPLKINMEPKNEGLEDDVPFETGDFQVPMWIFQFVWSFSSYISFLVGFFEITPNGSNSLRWKASQNLHGPDFISNVRGPPPPMPTQPATPPKK